MSKCIYCGKSAGLFSSKHKDCEEMFTKGKLDIVARTRDYITGNEKPGFESFNQSIKEISENGFITNDLKLNLIVEGFDQSVNKFLDDGLLSDDEENKLAEFKDNSGLGQDVLNKNGSFFRVLQASILRSILNGIIPEGKINISGTLPFNFQKEEKIIWVFNSANYYDQITKTHYEGRSQGVSIKVVKGLYYRTGQFKGNPVKTTEMKLIAVGILALTDQNIYFSSPVKSLRIPYQKILTINEYSDGIGIQEDKASAKPKTFGNIDGWFTYNVVKYLSAK